MPIWKHIPHWLRNKYLLATVFFTVWMLYFDHNDLFQQVARTRERKDLIQSRDYYRKEIEQTQQELTEIRRNPASLEKFAREKHLMKKEHEEIYLIAKEKNP